ncbi:tetratricopeptide repeat protein [Nocardia caishijiensis]|uniref:Tetratricopeptide repeat protein n=1 Tax=Nocardia caishijiensis TaxID=184756 RepID=A0ABQ6YPK0_9NOCA|nr:tetratricopeptide repeat protein [Nocardia caishijiensis]KAF0847719.1 tetratricopeptide repeat protein [Nocardia caishijiensis]
MPVRAALERARIALEIGRAEEARGILGAVLAQAPDDPELLVALGNTAFALDDPQDAWRCAGRAIGADPHLPEAQMLAAMSSAMLGEWTRAREHSETVLRLLPHEPAALLLAAWMLVFGPSDDSGRAVTLLSEAVELAPDDAGVHCSAAEIYERLGDAEGLRRHVGAGLLLDPTHTDLLRMQARLEFGGVDGGRGSAVATLRGLLAQAPTDRAAGRLLAEVHWRALMRLAAWVWFFAGCYATAAMWAPPLLLRMLSPVLLAAIPLAWFGVFHKLRRQLPAGYLRARVVRPRVVLALLVTAGSAFGVVVGAVAMRSEYVGFVRLGSWMLVLGVVGAALAHLVLYTAWLRPGRDDPDPEDGFDFAFSQVLVHGAVVVPLVVIAGLARGFVRQPAVFGAVLAVVGAILFTLVLEAGIGIWRGRAGFRRLPAMAAIVCALLTGTGAAVWWGSGEIVDGEMRGREFVNVPAPPTISPREFPTIPTLRVPTLVVPPTVTVAPTVAPTR